MAVATKDTPVGYELDGVKKQAVIQLMGSRHWGRTNPIHWDPVYAEKQRLKAPIQTGQMSAAYLAEMCVNFFGETSSRMRAYLVSLSNQSMLVRLLQPME